MRGDSGAASMSNRYCERAGLQATPCVEEVLASIEGNLLMWMVVALLERGSPMTVEEMAERLTRAGVVPRSGDMVLSLKKAWHGREPIHRAPDGRLGLNLSSPELGRVLWKACLRPPRFPVPEPLPEPPQPGNDVPLTMDEIVATFRDRSLYGFSACRQAAAVLDARGGPMAVEEVEGVLAGMTRHRCPFGADRLRFSRNKLVTVHENGRLTLDRSSPDLGAMRRAVRKLARPAQLQRAREERWAKDREERKVALAEERSRQAEETSRLRLAIVRAVPGRDETPCAVSVLDVRARSMRTLVGEDLGSLPEVLEEIDVLIGLHIRETLHALGLDPDRWRLVDLKPPRKSRSINRRGRTLAITPELLISSTTGISRPLGDPSKIARYLAEGQTGKVARRLESDAKALFAFYQYGVLHNCVRLRWGFLDELYSVEWALPGEVHLGEMLRRAEVSGVPIDLVTGSAPGWAEPWSRARRCHVLGVEPWRVTVRLDGEVWRLDKEDIQAIRFAGGPDAT